MRQLIVHIGAPKAGSTSLQQQLIANRETLGERGIGLVAPWGTTVEGLVRFGDALLGRKSSAERRRAIDDLRHAAGDFHGDTLILSYENLQQAAWWRRLPRKLGAIAGQAGYAFKVTAFIRPPHLAINSTYTQNVRALRTSETFAAFIERTRGDRRYDLPRCYRQWTGLEGGSFHPIAFTEAELSPNLFIRFFAEFSVAGDRLDGALGLTHAHNPGPGPKTVELMRRLAAYGASDLAAPARYDLSAAALKRAGVAGWNADRFSGVTNQIRDALDRQLAASNQAFADRHWQRLWHDLFKNDYEPDFVSNELALAPSRDTHDELESVIEELAADHGIALKR